MAAALAAAVALVLAPVPNASADALTALQALPCPAVFPGELDYFGSAQIDAAKQGDFEVAGVSSHLETPIDWRYDPLGSAVYRRALPDLVWLDPLLYAYDSGGDTAALDQAKAILLDFAATHERVKHHDADVWERKRAGDRLIRIVYVLRAATCANTLGADEATKLLTAARRHARFLRDTPNTARRSNHDLIQDLALMAAGRYLPFMEQANHNYHSGDLRFQAGIAALVDPRTGVHLEHTASYQVVSVDRLASYLDLAVSPPAKLVHLLAKMRDVSSWFAMPDGMLAPLGDTPFRYPAPPYALADSAQDVGLSPTRVSGFEMVKEPGSYFVTTAGYHRPSHKQADELSFDLFEDGHRVIVDSGRDDPGQGPPGAKPYTLSSQAHSTLTVDGHSFPLSGDFYGSALDAEGSGDGWFAIEGHNPLLASSHVSHHRLFLYRPGVALVIVDRLKAAAAHNYSRFVQIAPGLHATQHGDTTSLRSGNGFKGTVWSHLGGANARARLWRGREDPLRGWYAPPGITKMRPRWALELRTHSRSADLLTTVGIGPEAVKAKTIRGGVRVKLPGGTFKVTARGSGHALKVAATPVS